MTANPGRAVEIFSEAIQLPAGERAAFLDRACGTDESFRRKIEYLLRINDRAGSFLEQPAAMTAEGRTREIAGEKSGDRIDRYKLLQQIGEGG
jgi:eukaryotic-like serine/threonine-protein kinase